MFFYRNFCWSIFDFGRIYYFGELFKWCNYYMVCVNTGVVQITGIHPNDVKILTNFVFSRSAKKSYTGFNYVNSIFDRLVVRPIRFRRISPIDTNPYCQYHRNLEDLLVNDSACRRISIGHVKRRVPARKQNSIEIKIKKLKRMKWQVVFKCINSRGNFICSPIDFTHYILVIRGLLSNPEIP